MAGKISYNGIEIVFNDVLKKEIDNRNLTFSGWLHYVMKFDNRDISELFNEPERNRRYFKLYMRWLKEKKANGEKKNE